MGAVLAGSGGECVLVRLQCWVVVVVNVCVSVVAVLGGSGGECVCVSVVALLDGSGCEYVCYSGSSAGW